MGSSAYSPSERHVGPRDLTEWGTAAGRRLVSAAHVVARWAGPHAVLLVTLGVGVVLVTALTAASSEVYEAVTDDEGIAMLDRPVLDAAIAARSPAVNDAVTAFTDVGGPIGMPILAAVATLGLALHRRRWSPVVLVLAAAAGSLLMTVVGKAAVGRSRPPLTDAVPPYEDSASFPSGHSLNALVIAGVIAYVLVRRQHSAVARAITIGLATLFAAAMGLSRVFLGHHWLTDVVVAWTLGLAWLTVVVVAHRLYLTVWHRPREAARTEERQPAPLE